VGAANIYLIVLGTKDKGAHIGMTGQERVALVAAVTEGGTTADDAACGTRVVPRERERASCVHGSKQVAEV
jgi:hypothetical protein